MAGGSRGLGRLGSWVLLGLQTIGISGRDSTLFCKTDSAVAHRGGVPSSRPSCVPMSPAFNHVHCCSGRGLGVERNACMAQMVPSSNGAELSGEW